MHEAYEAAPILEKLPLQIESIACYEDTLLVGTKQGHLLLYKVKPARGSGDRKFEVSLERSNKSFAKKPITQLAAIPECYILISLSDNVISVHDLQSFTQITCVSKTRGATLFAADLQKHKSLSGEVHPTLRLCVAVRRKLQMFYWKNREFLELQSDLSLPDTPKCMAWCKDSICVSIKREYCLIKVQTGDQKELFPWGSRQQEPVIKQLGEDRLALGRDEMSILINSEGGPTMKYPLTWSDIPLMLEYDPPYVIGVLPKYVEIRTIETRLLIQSIDLTKPKLICHGSGHVYLAANNFVWRLASIPISIQIKQLLQNKEFELALSLTYMTDESDSEKQKLTQHIKNLYAFELFTQHRFEESMTTFSELGTDASHVIGLYPNLLPQDYRNQLEYPDKLPDLEGGELEKGLLALIDYLTQKRNELLKDINKEMQSTAIVEGTTTIKSKKQLSQIVDTTLLKCYLQTNDALVAPLLRLKDNNCHVDESERVLRKKEKFSELIILYEKKGLHKKALELLMKQAARPASPLKGHDRTVQYLQHLGTEHLNLIFEYAEWVLKQHPEDGIKIFTEDIPEVENLPRDQVLEYLDKISKDLAIQYLEHVVVQCKDETPDFHNCLVHLYREKVQAKMTEYLHSLPEGHPPSKAGQEPGELGELRAKLLRFLDQSRMYVPERLLTRFPLDGFYEERAILLGRLGRHSQALGIYVHILQDTELAEKYCKRHYNKHEEGNKEVYASLIKLYLRPPEPSSLGLMSGVRYEPKVNMPAALRLLENHASKVDTAQALEMLPADTEIKKIVTYLENVMEEKAASKRSCQVLKSLLYAENLQILQKGTQAPGSSDQDTKLEHMTMQYVMQLGVKVHEQRIHYQKVKCVITEEKNCKVCRKRIGSSAFARYPNGVIVHYGCRYDASRS